jgi:hypothetical protein
VLLGESVLFTPMRFLIVLLLWAILICLCWPLALLFIFLWPILWILSIPFRIAGVALHAMLALVGAILFLPARLAGYRRP